jgi:hypothetical protein
VGTAGDWGALEEGGLGLRFVFPRRKSTNMEQLRSVDKV